MQNKKIDFSNIKVVILVIVLEPDYQNTQINSKTNGQCIK